MISIKQKKRANSESLADSDPKSVEQSPPKKQKKVAKKQAVAEEVQPVKNGDAPKVETVGADGEQLTRSQLKRRKNKVRRLNAMARVIEAGGVPQKPKKAAATVEEKMEQKIAKRAESKKLRQEKRLQEGQFKVEQVNLTPAEITLRIEAITSRGELTKSARRKLGILKKKLAVLEGTAEPKAAVTPNNGVGENEKTLSKSEKRRLRREKAAETGDDAEKPVDIQVFEKKTAKKGQAQQKVAGTKGAENKNKKQSKVIVPKQVEEEEEEDDDEDDDEEANAESEAESGEEDAEAAAESDEEVEEEEKEDSDDEEEEEDATTALNATQEDSDDDEDDDEDEEEKDDEEEEEEEDEETEAAPPAKEKKVQVTQQAAQGENPDKKTRYVLFVGNLPYSATTNAVKEHFLTKVQDVSSVRIPTKPGTQVPRGFGYVEFTNSVDYEKGLSLHQTFFEGRRINVEYTQGGSKQASKRGEVVSKNQKLHAMRKAGQLAGSVKHDQKRSVRRFKKRENERQPM